MGEKRLSLRFREDNEQDMKAWEYLNYHCDKNNISRNAFLIGLITENDNKKADISETEKIADLVAEKVSKLLSALPLEHPVNVSGKVESVAERKEEEAELIADDPDAIGTDAADFLDMF